MDVIETDSFRANRITMKEYGLQDRVIEINQAAAGLARRLADEYSRVPASPRPFSRGRGAVSGLRERFVAGSIGPSGKLPSADDPELSNVSFDELADVFREQAAGLFRGGVDLLLIETSQDILEVKAAITGIQKAFEQTGMRVPIQAQVTLDTTGRMLLGTDITAALSILDGMPIDVIGLNCSTGPEHMREPIRILGEQSSLPVSCIPNAGLPLNVDGQAVYPLEPEPFAEAIAGVCREEPYLGGGRMLRDNPGSFETPGRETGLPSTACPADADRSRALPLPQRQPPCTRTRRLC